MSIEWKSKNSDLPEVGALCLTRMKDGVIEGEYVGEYTFLGYYFGGDREWYADEWVLLEGVE